MSSVLLELKKALSICFYIAPLPSNVGLINLTTSLDSGTLENFPAFKDQINSQFFMVAIILMCWTILAGHK
jgi:hypothetical protein